MENIISVIIPIYNVEKYLTRCVESVLNQSFKDFNIILVDDGSPDQCPTICDDFKNRFHNITVIHQNNKGLSAARNAGIEYVIKNKSSQYITFIDSDDWVHPQYLEVLYSTLKTQKAKISCVRYKQVEEYRIDPIDDNYGITKEDPENVFFSKTGKLDTYAWGRLFELSLFNEIRFPEGKIWEDTPTMSKVFFAVDKIAVANVKLYYYFRNPNGIMLSPWTPKRFDEIEAHKGIIPFFTDFKDGKYLSDAIYELARVEAKQINEIISKQDIICDSEKYLAIIREELRKVIKTIEDRKMDVTKYEDSFDSIKNAAYPE